MGNNRLVSPELEKIFVELLTLTCDADMRTRFEQAGISSTEVRVLSPNGIPGCFMETLSIENRIEHYFETIDWSKRVDIAKLLPIINESLRKLSSYHLTDVISRATAVFEKTGVYFDGDKLVRRYNA